MVGPKSREICHSICVTICHDRGCNRMTGDGAANQTELRILRQGFAAELAGGTRIKGNIDHTAAPDHRSACQNQSHHLSTEGNFAGAGIRG